LETYTNYKFKNKTILMESLIYESYEEKL